MSTISLGDVFDNIKRYHAFEGDGCRIISLPSEGIYFQTCFPTTAFSENVPEWNELHAAKPALQDSKIVNNIDIMPFNSREKPSLENFPFRTTIYFKKQIEIEKDPYVINLKDTFSKGYETTNNLMKSYKSKLERNKTRIINIFIFLLTILFIIFAISFVMGI
jgi:hypothetical protein